MAQENGNGRFNGGMVKWVTASFLTGILAALGFLVVADRTRIEGDAREALSIAMDNRKDIAVLKTMQDRLRRIEAKQDKLLEQLKK